MLDLIGQNRLHSNGGQLKTGHLTGARFSIVISVLIVYGELWRLWDIPTRSPQLSGSGSTLPARNLGVRFAYVVATSANASALFGLGLHHRST
jgi:hypothetical protein